MTCHNAAKEKSADEVPQCESKHVLRSVETSPKRPNAGVDSRLQIFRYQSLSLLQICSSFQKHICSSWRKHNRPHKSHLGDSCSDRISRISPAKCPVSNPRPARKKQAFFSPRSGSFSFTGRPCFAIKENRKFSARLKQRAGLSNNSQPLRFQPK